MCSLSRCLSNFLLVIILTYLVRAAGLGVYGMGLDPGLFPHSFICQNGFRLHGSAAIGCLSMFCCSLYVISVVSQSRTTPPEKLSTSSMTGISFDFRLSWFQDPGRLMVVRPCRGTLYGRDSSITASRVWACICNDFA